MHPTEHRGLRELFAMACRLRNHWRTLADRIDAQAPAEALMLRTGADEAGALIAELTDLTAARDLYGRPLAQGLGARLAGVHNALLDTSLEVNQALRFAALDVVHVVTLLDYLARAAAHDGDAELRHSWSGGRSGRARRRTRCAPPRRRWAPTRTAPCSTARPGSPGASAMAPLRPSAPSASGSTAARGADAPAQRQSARPRESFVGWRSPRSCDRRRRPRDPDLGRVAALVVALDVRAQRPQGLADDPRDLHL